MPDVNQMVAGGLADRVMGQQPPGGGAVDPQMVEQGRMHLAEALKIMTSDPQVMIALQPDLKGFVMTIKQFAEMGAGQGGGQPQAGPMAGGPQMGQPPAGPMPGPAGMQGA